MQTGPTKPELLTFQHFVDEDLQLSPPPVKGDYTFGLSLKFLPPCPPVALKHTFQPPKQCYYTSRRARGETSV